jgi:hypothetical protein
VTVAGTRVPVTNGVFRHWMSLGRGKRLIRLQATARAICRPGQSGLCESSRCRPRDCVVQSP